MNFTSEETHTMITDILLNIVDDPQKTAELADLLEITPSQFIRFAEKIEFKTSDVSF